MRKEFLANVSHELKTPIALIQGYAEGLQEEINDDPESRQFYCDVIVDEAAKMNNMVKKLLTLNQLEFGNDVVAMERFDLTALVKNYIQSAAILTKQHEITVRMEEYPPIYAWADEFKIEEVFMNFFSNAVNHCEDDKIIEVKWNKRTAKYGYLYSIQANRSRRTLFTISGRSSTRWIRPEPENTEAAVWDCLS